eukprot:15367206-Ditylum_brightwellii.AAC.1
MQCTICQKFYNNTVADCLVCCAEKGGMDASLPHSGAASQQETHHASLWTQLEIISGTQLKPRPTQDRIALSKDRYQNTGDWHRNVIARNS